MAHEFRLPDIGEGLVEAQIVRWLVPVGGEVRVDQPVVEVETDKTVVELPSPYAGVVLHHGAPEGDTLPVGEVLVVVGQAGETWTPAAVTGGVASPQPAQPARRAGGDAPPIVGTLSEEAQDLTRPTPAPIREPQRPQALPKARRLAHELGVDLASVAATGPNGRITEQDVAVAARNGGISSPDPASGGDGRRSRTLSPVVRRLAKNLGVDIGSVAGTGPGGRVTRDDVLSAADPVNGDGQAPVAPAAATPVTAGERRRLSPTRRAIAANVSRSWAEIPQVTAFDEVDATRLLGVRKALQARRGVQLPVDALLVGAVVPALRAFPELDARLEGDELVLLGTQDVGVAVDTPDGLLIAVVRDAGGRDLLDLAAEVRRLGERGRARALGRADLSGQGFTVSNIGGTGGGFGTPLVPAGTVGILSVGQARDKPVVSGGKIEIAPMMPLSLSYDHRVIDGATGRRFLAMVMENLAEPALFLA